MSGSLAANVIEFARLLRRAGLPVGPADMLAAQAALSHIDIGARIEVHTALRATMVHRHEQQAVFDHAFALFWRDPAAGQFDAMMAMLGEKAPKPEQRPAPGGRRVAEAFTERRDRRESEQAPEIDATLTVSAAERLQTMDFEAMSAAEITAARNEIRRLHLPLDLRRTRRTRPDPQGAIVDMAATMRAGLRHGGEMLTLARASRKVRPPPLVVLCDISGSMTRYAQILLHFLHAVANDRDRVSTFLFGTRLSNITRQLRHRDPEAAFANVAAHVPDWSGGTRIGEAIEVFNQQWARRVLGQGAIVLLVTDGLDRDGAKGLAEAMDRLHRSCRRLIWLNPLLRWDGFEPKSQGIRAMLPHVDEFRPVHNLASLRALITLLSRPAPIRGRLMETSR
ncbi:MAG: VWA domain-containing protein [Acetobacteraceae bacterium]